jgi:hypothetical protein
LGANEWKEERERKEGRKERTIIHGIYSIGNIKNYKDLSENENRKKDCARSSRLVFMVVIFLSRSSRKV